MASVSRMRTSISAGLSRLSLRIVPRKVDRPTQASPGDIAYRSRLLRAWRSGARSEVLTELDAQASARHWQLVREGVDFVRAFARDPASPAVQREPRVRNIVLETVLDYGGVEAARSYAAQFPLPDPRFSGLFTLQSLAIQAPATVDPRTGDLRDDPALDLQVVPRRGARDMVVVCCGSAHRFAGPLASMHQWLRQLDASLVYMRDFERMYYLAGIRSCGSHRATVEALRRVAADLGADRLHFIGNSSGGYGALRLGLAMAARSVLCFGGITRIVESREDVLSWAAERGGAVAAEVEADGLDLSASYGACARAPRVRLVYGAEYPSDRAEAEAMANVPGAELVALPGIAEHGVVTILAREGKLFEHLAWVMA